jgi:hypothetical protein
VNRPVRIRRTTGEIVDVDVDYGPHYSVTVYGHDEPGDDDLGDYARWEIVAAPTGRDAYLLAETLLEPGETIGEVHRIGRDEAAVAILNGGEIRS